MSADGFAPLLRSAGVAFVPRECWLVVGNPTEAQGWKLHVSSTPRSAESLLTAVLPVLQGRGVSFKIARDVDILEQLNEGGRGATQVGKFVTIYDASPDLVAELCAVTRGHIGPIVPSDLRLGDVVYARYGGYQPVLRKDPLGQVQRYLRQPDGRLVVDAYTVPFQPPDWVSNPFAQWPNTSTALELGPYDRIADRFLIVDVVRRHAKGDTFLALDLKSQLEASVVVLKQGRRHCMEDRDGRDIVERLRRQDHLLTDIAALGIAPTSRGFVEWGGDGYLAIEHVEGDTIEAYAGRILRNRPWFRLLPRERKQLLTAMDRTAAGVERLHARGLVHRDLTASNVLVDEYGERVIIIDFELAAVVGDLCAFGKGTPGFMSAEQEKRAAPHLTDDVYALGQLLILATTGIDPRRVELAKPAELRSFLAEWYGGVDTRLIPLILDCVRSGAAERPSVAEFRRRLGSKRAPPLQPHGTGVGRLIRDGARGLVSQEFWDADSGTWLSIPIPAAQGHVDYLEAHRSIHRGNAGVLYGAARLAGLDLLPRELGAAVDAAAAWLAAGAAAPDLGQVGLHFGEAGVSLAFDAAQAVGLTSGHYPASLSPAREDDLAGWLDVTHGAAGIALASLQRREPDIALAHRQARAVLAAQRADGSWAVPEGVEGLSGETLTGFAHGVAGMGFALLEAGAATGDTDLTDGALRAIEWLERVSYHLPSGVRVWAYGDRHEHPWNWWCHGGPGIALFFLRAYERLGQPRHADLARAALRVHGASPRSANLTLCHGLAGLGQACLEAHRVLGDRVWRDRAEEVATLLEGISMTATNGGVFWLAEHPEIATADFMVGNAGIIDFLARLHVGEQRLQHPLLPKF